MHRLKQGWILPLGIQVRCGSETHGSYDCGPQVRQNVTKQVGADHHIKPVRMRHEMRGQDIDVELIGFHIGILL